VAVTKMLTTRKTQMTMRAFPFFLPDDIPSDMTLSRDSPVNKIKTSYLWKKFLHRFTDLVQKLTTAKGLTQVIQSFFKQNYI